MSIHLLTLFYGLLNVFCEVPPFAVEMERVLPENIRSETSCPHGREWVTHKYLYWTTDVFLEGLQQSK